MEEQEEGGNKFPSTCSWLNPPTDVIGLYKARERVRESEEERERESKVRTHLRKYREKRNKILNLGWKIQTNSEGDPYYVNPHTGDTQSEEPTEPPRLPLTTTHPRAPVHDLAWENRNPGFKQYEN